MKIVFASYVYIPEYNQPQAWVKRIKSYIGTLEALAQKHTLISIEQIDYEGNYLHHGVQYHFKRFTNTGRRLPFKLHSYITRLKPDVVIIHGLHFSAQIIQLRMHLGSKVKIIVQHHAEHPFKNPFKKRLQQLADKCIDAYLFASRQMGLEWVDAGNLLSAQKIHGVMEVSSVFGLIDKQLALTKLGISGQPIYLWVGRLNQNKDPLTVVNAFLAFVKMQPSARLYMIYQTEELLPQIIAMLAEHSEQAHAIKLVGKVPHDELLYWFNAADVILSASHYEGSSAVVCEAMSCGCVPVITDILSFKMMTDNGDCGLLYQPGNTQQLLNCLVQTTRLNMAQKREKALAYYTANLSFTAISGRIEQVIASLF